MLYINHLYDTLLQQIDTLNLPSISQFCWTLANDIYYTNILLDYKKLI